MMFYTSHSKRWSYRSILGVIFGVIIFSGLFSGLFSKKALASNNYIDNIQFTSQNGLLKWSFHVKTTFTITIYCGWSNDKGYACGNGNNNVLHTDFYPYFSFALSLADYTSTFPDDWTANNFTFTAGHIYSGCVIYGNYWKQDPTDTSLCVSASGFTSNNYFYFTDSPAYWPIHDDDHYYFIQFPSASISYPHDNDEIAGAFNVQGSFSIPAGKSADYITISFNPVGAGYSLLTHFSQYISGQNQGTFSIPVSGIPAGYYDITISFVGGDFDGYIGATIYNVHLVNDIPPALSTGETTPSSPNFNFISPDDYYLQHSNYSTSTGLFNNLTNSVGALLQSVGNSLSAFAGKFSLSDAQQTATMVAGSISTIRTYSNNLNSFFGSLPVSQILFLYLILFVAVIVFRLIKNLVNLIKP
jgi:hypothetical protein